METLINLLIGSKKQRLGALPCDEHRMYLQEVVGRCIEQNQPIHLVTMWGALKAYGLFEYKGVDYLDVMAFQRYANLQEAVRKYYDPGIKVTIIREDFTEMILTSGDVLKVVENMQIYHQHLNELRQHNNQTYIDFVNESELISKRIPDLSQYINNVIRNAKTIKDCAIGVKSTQDLEELGWKGGLSREQWEFGLKRTMTENPHYCNGDCTKAVSTYYGNALARNQIKALNFNPCIKVSFVPHPPGTDLAMMRGRLEWKVKESKTSNKSIAPWAGFSLMVDGDWHAIGVNQMRNLEARMRTIDLNGFKFQVPYVET